MKGYVAALGCSLCLGLAVAVSRYAFEGGTNGVTVAALRAWLVVALAGGYCLWSGRGLSLPWRQWRHCLWLGLLMANMFYANIAAVQFIPISLAALLFFTYPTMVAVGNAWLDQRWPDGGRLLALAIAFIGLAIMLGVSLASLDPIGVMLSLSAALATTGNVIGSARVMPTGDRWVIFWHMALIAACTLLVVALATNALNQPETAGGWAGMVGVALLQASGIPLFYIALADIGPERSSMFNNVQPVVSIIAAYALFGEVLTLPQWLGAAMVLGGIALMQWFAMRKT